MQDIVVALVQANITVGALSANVQKIVRMAHDAAKAGASIIVFPELALSGYPPEDLILKKHFLKDCMNLLDRMAREVPRDRVVIAGTPRRVGESAFNAAAIFHGGKVVGSTTSVGYGHTSAKTIAFGYLPLEIAEQKDFLIEAFGKAHKATRGPRCLYDAKMERLKA